MEGERRGIGDSELFPDCRPEQRDVVSLDQGAVD